MEKCSSLLHILARRELGDRTPFSTGGVWCGTHQKNNIAQFSIYMDNRLRGESERGETLTVVRTSRSIPKNPVGNECEYVIDKRMNLSVEGGEGTGEKIRDERSAGRGSCRWEETWGV
ncbi:hypothetical protein PUN28_006153 [Cardiocondyla obscurior]|uniref:Uncharacterized protein n=1 Tax=Cardiocondyla obscurior TaxID=286306 RepID=A0AAW2GA97_9HYME